MRSRPRLLAYYQCTPTLRTCPGIEKATSMRHTAEIKSLKDDSNVIINCNVCTDNDDKNGGGDATAKAVLSSLVIRLAGRRGRHGPFGGNGRADVRVLELCYKLCAG